MQHSELPQIWSNDNGVSFFWQDPNHNAGFDINLIKTSDTWYVRYWIWGAMEWHEVELPLTPDPPFVLAEALYYAAQ